MNIFSPKTPEEEFFLSFDFVNWLGSASISDADIKIYEYTASGGKGTERTSTMIDDVKEDISGSVVSFWIQAGTAGNMYEIECEITASDDSVYEGQGFIQVQDVKQSG